MALWPNGRYMTRSTYKGFGVAPGLDARLKGHGDSRNRFVSASFAKTASTPDGYDMKAVVPPLTAGSMATASPVFCNIEGTGNLLKGGPLTGTGSITFTVPDASLSMTVGLSANTMILSVTGDNAALKLTIGMSGNWTLTMTGTSSLSMVVPFEGTGSVVTMSGTSNLKGLLSMQGEWTPFTELSPENLARSVWEAIASEYNDVGTMGNKLNTASSGGVDMNALAQAVWEYATRTLTSGGGGSTNALTLPQFLALK